MAILIVLIWIIVALALVVGASNNPLRLEGSRFALAVVICGVMGAAVSGILATAKGTVAMRIPDQLLDSSELMLGRVMHLPAVAAMAAPALSLSGGCRCWSMLLVASCLGSSPSFGP